MTGFFESAVVPAADPAQLSRPDEQVPHWLADARLDRRERATKRAKDLKSRTGDRRET